MPACETQGSTSVNVTVGIVSNTNLNFVYSASASVPTITSLNVSSSNPALKAILQINGMNFGSNSADAKVHLSNATGKIYPLKIFSYTDT